MGVKPSDIARAIAEGNKVMAQLRRVCPKSDEVLPPSVEAPKPNPKRIRQSSRPLLNKLETECGIWLSELYPKWNIRAQAVRFRLGNGIWYRPDFAAVVPYDNAFAWEVKGPHAFRGGLENLKVAASLYPEWIWILVWKDEGLWKTQRVLP